MPLNVPLSQLRIDLRAETGQTLTMTQGVQSQLTQDIQLDRQQRELWDAYEWPHLRHWIDVTMSAGQSVYNYPTEMPFDQVTRIYIASGNETRWKELLYGLRAYDVPLGTPPRGTPVRWGNKITVTGGVTDPNGQMQLVPMPDKSGTLRFEGLAPATRLVNDTDKCVIDSTCIVLFAAAEILAVNKQEAATLKLTKAQNYLRRLLINSGASKRKNYSMGGSSTQIDHMRARPYIDYIPSVG